MKIKIICQICGTTDNHDIDILRGLRPTWEYFKLEDFGVTNAFTDYEIWICPHCLEKIIYSWEIEADETGEQFEVPIYDWRILGKLVKDSLSLQVNHEEIK